ncbi:serine-type D-Ala-D-Ala carboxypeptidase [Pasteurellaceae bacterium Macca]|nr:serine-type D-Ala-D-Ala carboxypeptidase [Pasteurellaceae bacterium Macca]
MSFFSKFTPKWVFLTLLFPSFSSAQINVEALAESLPSGTSLAFIAKNLDTQTLIADYHSQQFMLPASTQKVLTALASKLVLPPDFTFQTALLTSGTIENGTLKGDLILRFSGDPTLTRGQFLQLIDQLPKQGIRHIQGNILLDTTVFTSHDKASGWVWNDLTVCFSAPASAANLDHNCFYANLDANKPEGSTITVDLPSAYPVTVESSAYVAEKSEAGYCQLDVVMEGINHYHIKGCLARQEKPFGLSFAVQDPTAFAINVLQKNLTQVGVTVEGKIQQITQTVEGKLLAEHRSEPLDVLLKKMMKKSDNQIADSLFRTLAHKQHQRPATFPLASQTLRQLLNSKGGIQFGHSIIADGSGLSRHNQISAQTMLQTLEVIAQNEEVLHLFDTFPIAGIDGSLSGRSSLSSEPLANNVIAKTGALKGVYNLAGFMKNARGERIAFVQFINGYSTGDMERKTKRAPLNQFEQNLYQAIYQE